MFKDLIHNTGLHAFSMIAMIIFVVFFLGVLLWTLFLKKDFVQKMENLPLEGEEMSATTETSIEMRFEIRNTEGADHTDLHG